MQSPSQKMSEKIKCHFVSNTHWDREWRFSMQRTRYMLVYMMDMLLDIFEKQPDYKSFHLDSQTIPLLDYLEVRPEKEQTLKQLVHDKKLFVGPWFTLPDEFSISGESIIRNLLLGHKIAKQFGHVSKTGYSPFSWGQISQMPQIYKGFGIHMTAFYRGVNTRVAPRSEFIWQGADGTQILASRLGQRPRYNVWYVLQRPVYWNLVDENERNVDWASGYGPFKLMNKPYCDLDMKYTHPPFEYHGEHINEKAMQALREQDNDWSTPHRFWSCGHDSSCPDIREVDLIRDCSEALFAEAEVFHSSFEDFQQSVIQSVSSNLQKVKGEMRNYSDSPSTSPLLGWICSARMDLKIENFETERALFNYAEPLAVFAAMLGAPFPQRLIDLACNYLLRNHGHDSIGGCSRGTVGEDMQFRFRQCREISKCVMESALIDIIGSIDLSSCSAEDMALVVFNPSCFSRSEVLPVEIVIPQKWQNQGFEITDDRGRRVDIQIFDIEENSYQYVQSPNDVVTMIPTTKYDLLLNVPHVSSMGYRTFMAKPIEGKIQKAPDSLITGPQTMENDNMVVSVNSNGSLKITDKRTKRTYDQMGYFMDTAELGNPWEHDKGQKIGTFTTLNEKAEIVRVKDGPLEAVFRVEMVWYLPAERSLDNKGRSERFVPVTMVNNVSLKKNAEWVDITTSIVNTARDHYLQVVFPPQIEADHVDVQGQFDVIRRSVHLPHDPSFREEPQTEQPMNSFLDISDGKTGLAILNEGLKAYEATDAKMPELRLTLIRAFPLKLCATTEWTDYSRIDKSSQCLGKNVFHYAILPHRGDWEQAELWKQAEKFTLPLLAAQTAPTKHGTEPMQGVFLETDPDCVSVSSVKPSENGSGWVVRLFNPLSKTLSVKLRLNGGKKASLAEMSPVERLRENMTLPGTSSENWTRARMVTLEEVPEKNIPLNPDGSCLVEMTPKKIVTVEFLP